MKINPFIFLLFLTSLCRAQMVNPGFEQTSAGSYTSGGAVNGWTIESAINNGACTYTNWTPGSTEFSILATPFNNFPFQNSPLNIIGHSPLGGNVIACLGDTNSNFKRTRIRQTFAVTSSNVLLQYAFAGYWEDGGSGHGCCDQPGIKLTLYDSTGSPLVCNSMSIFPGSGCQSTGSTFSINISSASWSNWQAKFIDLTSWVGQSITMEFITTDCSCGAHFATTLLDIITDNKLHFTPNNSLQGFVIMSVDCDGELYYCPNSTYAVIQAPRGYYYYQWYGPSGQIGSPWVYPSSLLLTTPTLGTNYTVTMVNNMGCQYTKTFTIANTFVSIFDVDVSNSCAGGANGSATVYAQGSNAGYDYVWTNPSYSVISTGSVATGLAPGIYTVAVASASASLCGHATRTVTISGGPIKPLIIAQPFCSTPVVIRTSTAGSNYQWYLSNTAITGSTGFSISALTAFNGMKYKVGYDSPQGCRDSIEYVLLQLNPGSLSVPSQSIRPACTSASTGSATIVIQPNYMGPQTNFQYSVSSTGTMAPFSASAANGTVSTFPVTGLGGGVYTVGASDGYCPYSLTFTVGTFQFSSSLSTTAATLCPGGNLAALVNVTPTPSTNQFKYQWFPVSAVQATANAGKNATLSPASAPAGSYVTQVFSVIVTPSISPCPESKTLIVTRANPTVFPISPILPLCTSSSSLQLHPSPSNGLFVNDAPSPGLVDNNAVIHPEKAITGINSFTYAVNISTCIASASQTFMVSKFSSAQLLCPKITLCENAPPTLLDPFAQDVTASGWSGPGVSGNTFTPALSGPGINSILHKTFSLPDSMLCPDSALLQINVEALPIITAASGTVCSGEIFTINANGAMSYSYSSGSKKVSPLTTSSYSVWGLNKSGCKTNTAVVVTITVTPTPTMTIITSSGLPCAGEQITLTATGATNYSWTGGPSTASFETIVSFPVMFKINGYNAGCMGSAYYLQNVLSCTGVNENGAAEIIIYPNPAKDHVKIVADGGSGINSIDIIDSTGETVLSAGRENYYYELSISQLKPGIYVLRMIGSQKLPIYQKLIIE